jgi:hypothetical protein
LSRENSIPPDKRTIVRTYAPSSLRWRPRAKRSRPVPIKLPRKWDISRIGNGKNLLNHFKRHTIGGAAPEKRRIAPLTKTEKLKIWGTILGIHSLKI